MLTKGAIGNLVNRYRAVLRKCNLINTFGSLAVASMLVLGGAGVAGAALTPNANGKYEGTAISEETTIDLQNQKYTFSYPGAGSSGTETIALQILKDADNVIIKNGTINADNTGEIPSGQKPIKRLIQNYANLAIENVTLDGTGVNVGESTAGDYVVSFCNGTTNIKNSTIIANDDDYAFDVYYYETGGYDNVVVTVEDSDIQGRVQMDKSLKNTSVYGTEGHDHKLIFNNSTISNQSGGNGGAIEIVSGNFTAEGSTFTNNIASGSGGAICGYNNAGVSVKVENSTFKNNHAKYDGGAIASFRSLEISGSTFEGNTAQLGGANFDEAVTDDKPIGGGAIALGAVSNTSIASITDTVFKNNVSGTNGGAIATRLAKDADNSAAKLDIAATFIGNEAKKSGGAFYNTFYTSNGLGNGDGVTVTGIFEGNKAGENGGAIYNDGDKDKASTPNGGIMTITDSTFTGNTAGDKGGAIYNSGTLTLNGNNVFSGNTANGVANDIHNDGTLTINGTASLAGGISGTGTLNGSADLIITDAAVTISEEQKVEGTFEATATGDVTDQTGGDIETMQAQLGDDVNLTKMEEGLIAGEVVKNADGSYTKKTSTVLKDTLDQATAAPLAVNRILMNDVRKRMGDLRDTKEDSGVWMRWDGGKLKGDEGLTNNFNTIQIGADMLTGIKNVRAGVAGSFTHGDVDHNNGDGEMEAYTFAAYGTWMADNGMFADVIARVGFNNTELNIKGSKADLDNEALSLSAEYGWRLPVCNQFFVEPQVELTYTYVTGADFTINTASYDVDSMDSLLGRAGLAAGWKLPNDRGNVYARASVVHEFLGDAKITGTNRGNSIPHEIDGEDTWLEYGIGANVKLTDNTYVWADVERTEGADIEEEWRGTVGVRFSF